TPVVVESSLKYHSGYGVRLNLGP
ncbi:hypothetical protein Q604_UNBC15144G0001, partial [human gut metagenome]